MTSEIYTGELIIDDDSHDDLWHPSVHGFGTGWEKPEQIGYGATAGEFPAEYLIPQSDFQSIIKDKEATQTQLSQVITRFGLTPLNQAQTNFCFANAPTNCVRIHNLKNGQGIIDVSAASVACQVTGFRNQGGWAKDALDVIRTKGIVPTSMWPTNAISRQYDTPAAWAAATPYKATDWITPSARNMQQLGSLLLRNIPVAVAFNWWGHEVTAVDLVWLNGALALRCWNSWGPGYGSNGFFILQGSKMYPDDCVAMPSVGLGKSQDAAKSVAA